MAQQDLFSAPKKAAKKAKKAATKARTRVREGMVAVRAYVRSWPTKKTK